MSWQTWKTLNPKTTVLTGTKPVEAFNYDTSLAIPPDYFNLQNPVLLHPVYGLDVEKNPLNPKAAVYGITDSKGQTAKAYLAGFLREKTGSFEDTVGDRKLTLQFDPNTLILSAKDAEGQPVLTEVMVWIAWVGAHPNSELWQENRIRALQAAQNRVRAGRNIRAGRHRRFGSALRACAGNAHARGHKRPGRHCSLRITTDDEGPCSADFIRSVLVLSPGAHGLGRR